MALKVIDETKPDQESYVRFVREVTTLRDLGPQPGVLPMLDSYLPENPSKRNRAWLAMPVATPIDKALAGRPLQDVVTAVGAITETLARLERDHGIGHRDIKPGNLYEYEGAWLIGDFGLIAVPGAESLTGDGRPMGAAHFTAYEMALSPSTADPHPADVYSLGKTLWVLATGQHYAPDGHQPADVRGLRVGDWSPHRRAPELDQEIALMTQVRPEARPSKTQVARDLASWLELATSEPTLDLSGAGARMRAKIGRVMDAQDTEQRFKDLGAEAARRLQELVSPINQELKREFPRIEVDLMTDEGTKNLLLTRVGGRSLIWDSRRCTRIRPLDGPMALQLRMARALELYEDGTLYLLLMVDVAPQRTMGNVFHWQPSENSFCPGRERGGREDARGWSARDDRRGATSRRDPRRAPSGSRSGGLALGFAADEAADGPRPVLEHLDRLGGMTREVDPAHVVVLTERSRLLGPLVACADRKHPT